MATVFLATDLRHGRTVAVKMLREPFAGALGAERFLREIAVTAQLDHPHVVPLLDSGEADGELFFVMPFVEGETLRDRLARDKQLPLDAALSIAHDVLDALEYAHARGVIHRDIKPENILLAGGHARVADFGVARAVAASGGDSLTGTGIALGTPTYMSPEQASADVDVDRRSDLYAVGCVLYEMLAGQPPFSGPTMESIVRQHLVVPPRSVAELRPSVPERIATAIDRALAKSPADRFESAARFAAALKESMPAAAPVASAPSAVPPTSSASAIPVGTSTRPSRTIAVVLVVLVVAALAGVFAWKGRSPVVVERPLVAVLPFENLGGPEDAYFADGVTEEITARLARISGIRVISRTTAMRYRGTTQSLQEIARELGVQYVLEGTIRTERLANGSGQVRVTPDLVRADDDTHLWTDAYTAGLAPGEIFAVQSRIAERVAEAFNVSLLTPEVEAVRKGETADSAAYRATLLGRYQLARETPESLREAIGHFERATMLDPRYARPHAGLAAVYLRLPFFPASWLPQSEAFALAESAARRAVALDSASPDAHSALGEVLAQGYWRWADAEQEQRRAIALDPDNAEAHRRLSVVLAVLGQRQEALSEAERALALEPTAPAMHVEVANRLAAFGRVDEATAKLREALRLEPNNRLPHVNLAEFAAARGDFPRMADELSELRDLMGVGTAMRAWAGGQRPKTDVVKAVEAIKSPNPSLDNVRKAWLFATIDEPARSLDALEQAVSARAPTSVWLTRFPSVIRAIGKEPRFRALSAQIGFREPPPAP